MNLISILRLSLHNLWNNKLRTLLTVVVLTVVSFVVVLLIGVGYSFYTSVNANVNEMFRKDVSDITSQCYIDNGEYRMTGYFTPEQTEKILGIMDNDDGYITGVGFMNYNSYSKSFSVYSSVSAYDGYASFCVIPYYGKSNPFVGVDAYKDGYLVSGRMWNASDIGSDNCWLTKNAMSRFKLGDEITLTLNSYFGGDEQPRIIGPFTVAGFLDLKSSGQEAVFVDYRQFNDTPVSSGSDYYDPNHGKMLISNVCATMVPQEGFEYGLKTRNYLEKIVKRIKSEIDVASASEIIEVRSDVLDTMRLANILSIVIIGLLVFISLIIIMLSIGSVANTIKISAEQNRKFFGVMKAIGMKNKSLRHVLIGQIIIMTVIAVALASLAAYLTVGVAESVLGSLISTMFFTEEPIVICGISPIIPVAVALLLIGFVLLFTRSSLHEFSRMDVISVINEVN